MGENQIDKDKLSDLFQKANAIGDAYLWGFYWGRPGDGFDKLAGFDFENDLCASMPAIAISTLFLSTQQKVSRSVRGSREKRSSRSGMRSESGGIGSPGLAKRLHSWNSGGWMEIFTGRATATGQRIQAEALETSLSRH